MGVTVEEIVRLAEQLNPAEQRLLMQQLQSKLPAVKVRPTREMLIAEHERRKAAGAFENVESLYGKYANPDIPEVSAEEINEYLRQIGREWESEWDEFGYGD